MKYKLGDTIRTMVAPKLTAMTVDESLRQAFEEAAWRNGNAPMPEHIKNQIVDIVLTTQEMVDCYNETTPKDQTVDMALQGDN